MSGTDLAYRATRHWRVARGSVSFPMDQRYAPTLSATRWACAMELRYHPTLWAYACGVRCLVLPSTRGECHVTSVT
eukprot:133478-Rhodomonas_salina.1